MKKPKVASEKLYQGLRGNQNAAKEVRREAVIHSRTTPEKKVRYIRLANERGLKLSDWINNALDKYADEQEANDDKAAD
ncbi:hypothetical protein [Leclercia adecarboxylata]|uniref:hypothetical protein n=1 Tax=Leclercia adecarboxylata TaxID=83655 RepID=UPI0013C662BC|nr:hypothetical protein [Leclercia adecarboxylata]NEG94097.1 hypothetical protein [Leclercia adecarboxylata]